MSAEYSQIVDFFCALNQARINYLVLRNYENLFDPKIYVDGHGDIDILCVDPSAILHQTCAQCNSVTSSLDDGIHYLIFVAGQPVKLDLRHVGDGYYCTNWEKDLLERKVMRNGFYVMADEDYFYTLAYHAILQKRSLSRDYFIKLCNMADDLELNVAEYSESGLLQLLENHMRERGYRFTYSHDYMVPNRFHLVDSKLIDRDFRLWWKHSMFGMRVKAIQWLVNFKHALNL